LKSKLSTKIYLKIRPLICPFPLIEEHVPKKCTVVDIGCGYGSFSHHLSIKSNERNVIGIDLSEARILQAQSLYKKSSNLNFVCSNITNTKIPKANAVTAIDVLHHIASKEQQKKLLASCFSILTDDGVIIIKDLDTKPTWKYYWNYIHDFIMTKGEPVLYRSSNEMKNMLTEIGFKLEYFKSLKGYPYAHVLYVARKIAK